MALSCFCTEWTRNASCCPGKSVLKCPPRDSSRQRAAFATSIASATKLREEVLKFPAAICSNSAIPRFSESFSRRIPTRSHITFLTRFRTAVESSVFRVSSFEFSVGTSTDLNSELGALNSELSWRTVSPALAPKTSPSSREFDARRFAPWTPVQATSPAAYSPCTVLRPQRSVRMPPMQ